MAVHSLPTHRQGLALPVLGVVATLAIWGAAVALTPASAERSGTRGILAGGPVACETAEDALAAMERSRNGISLTCSVDDLVGAAGR